jgi:hypothetical protein
MNSQDAVNFLAIDFDRLTDNRMSRTSLLTGNDDESNSSCLEEVSVNRNHRGIVRQVEKTSYD